MLVTSRMVGVSLTIATLLLFGGRTNSLSAQEKQEKVDLKKLEAQVDKLDKALGDKFASEKVFREAREQLAKALEATNKSAEGASERSTNTKVIHLQTRILKLLSRIDGFIPSETHNVGVMRHATLALPAFAPRTKAREVAEELSEIHEQLLKTLQKSPLDEKEAEELVTKMVLAQEELAWLAGWPYTPNEIAQLKKNEELTEEVYLSRRERGIKKINEFLRQATESVGRQPLKPFVVHCPTSKSTQQAIALKLVESRGAEEYWTKGTVLLDDKEKAALLRDPNQPPPKTVKSVKTVENKPETTEESKVREWTAGSLKLKAEFVSSDGKIVKLRRFPGGQTVSIPAARLSKEDQAYLESLRKK